MFSIAEPGSSSSVKDGDEPSGIWKMEGGDICKTHITDSFCPDSEQEGRVAMMPFTVGAGGRARVSS